MDALNSSESIASKKIDGRRCSQGTEANSWAAAVISTPQYRIAVFTEMWRSIHKAFLFVFPLLSVAQPCLHRLGNQVIVTKVSRCFEVMAIWICFHFRSKFKHNCLIIIWVLFLEPIHRFLVSIPVSRQVFYHVARSRIQWGLAWWSAFKAKDPKVPAPAAAAAGAAANFRWLLRRAAGMKLMLFSMFFVVLLSLLLLYYYHY